MQVAVKIFFVAFWVSFITLAENQGKVPIYSKMYCLFPFTQHVISIKNHL